MHSWLKSASLRRSARSWVSSRWLTFGFAAGGIAAMMPFAGLLACDGRLIPGSDYRAFYVPFHEFARAEVLAGRSPLWIPYLACGAAMHAEQHAAPILVPLVLLLGANDGIKLTLFLHLALCYVGQFCLARELGLSRPASLFAGLAAVWGTFVLDHLAAGHVTVVFGYALIPWLFWLQLRLLAWPGARSAAVLGMAVAIFELSSHPQVLYYALLGMLCLVIGRFFFAADGRQARPLLWLAVAAAVAILISAVHWLPAVELTRDGMGETDRGRAAYAAMYAMDGSDLVRMIVPRLKGDELLGIAPFELGGYDHERGAYLGLSILPLALFGLSREGAARWQWGAAWLCIVAAEIALADHSPLWHLFCAAAPGLVWFRCQGRIFSVVGIVTALLAARGLDALARREPAGGRRSEIGIVAVTLAATVVLGDAMRRWFARFDWHDYLRYASIYLRQEYVDLAALIGVMLLVFFVCRSFGREFARPAYAAAIVFLMGDLYEYNVRHFQLVPPSGRSELALPRGVYPVRFVFLPGDLRATRTSLQYSWAAPLAIRSRTPAANTNDGAVLPRSISRLYAAIEGNPAPVLALSSCDWAYIESRRRWRELPGALPRFRFVRRGAEELCERPIGECGADDVHALRDALSGEITVRRDDPWYIGADVDAQEDGMFVLADTYYPGWRAMVDGEERTIVAAHGVFRGVRLSAGKHRVVFRYDPRSFKIGRWLSICGIIAAVSLAAAGWRGSRR